MNSLQDKIKALYQQGRAEGWKYPQLFKGLKSVGVKGYVMDVVNYTIEYKSDAETCLEHGPANWKVAVGAFNKAEVINAVRRTQAGKTDYPTFLKEIASAGIPKYFVSMAENTVSYVGADSRDKYVEEVPQV